MPLQRATGTTTTLRPENLVAISTTEQPFVLRDNCFTVFYGILD
jgi:hypothetical protein